MTKPLAQATAQNIIANAKNLEEYSEHSTVALSKDIAYKKSIANIPQRYKDAKLEAKTDLQEKLIEKFKANYSGKSIKDISDMLINGTVGTGKTHLAIGLINLLIEANIYCKYITEYELLNLYFMKKYDEFEKFKTTSVLVLDELGKRDLIDWQMIQIEELLSYRYNEQLPTVLITNRNKEDFKKFVGDRIVDRLKDNKVIMINLVGDSLRGASVC